MSPVEKLAKGLFAANLIAAAEDAGVMPPAVIRIDGAWTRNVGSRKRWLKAAAQVLSAAPDIDLAALTNGEPDILAAPQLGFLEALRKIIDRLTLVSGMLAAFALGVAVGAFIFSR